jgi:hypothetical protein
MRVRSTLAIGILILLGAGIGTTALSGHDNPAANQLPSDLSVVVRQLGREGDSLELSCDKVQIIGPSTLGTLSCILKNNTDKNILAANIAYLIAFESGGQESCDTRLHTIDTLVHPDFFAESKAIQPGQQRIIENPGPSFYANSDIKRVEAWIEYVEFADKTTLGDAEKGARIISNIREGAAKYKNWLAHKYDTAGKSATAAAALLRPDLPLAAELQLEDKYQEQGAKAYRTRLDRLYKTLGPKPNFTTTFEKGLA